MEAKAVIDGRGGPGSAQWAVAYQKFLGLSIVTKEDHGLNEPILMDATVEQRDGFRFIYTLPLSARRLLVEDTRYSDTAAVSQEEMRTEIKELHQRLKTTSVYVTHDQIEAMTMGDRVAVMREGTIVQTDAPSPSYEHPLVRRHPVNGKPALYSTLGYIQGIVGLEPAEAIPLLKEIQRYQTMDEVIAALGAIEHDLLQPAGEVVLSRDPVVLRPLVLHEAHFDPDALR